MLLRKQRSRVPQLRILSFVYAFVKGDAGALKKYSRDVGE